VRHADGRWERIGLPGVDDPWRREAVPPVVAPGERIAPEVVGAAALLCLALVVGSIAARRRQRAAWIGLVASPALLLVGLGGVLAIGGDSGVVDPLIVAAALAVVGAAWCALLVLSRAVPALNALALMLVAALTVLLSMRPVVSWSTGATDAYEPAHRAQQHVVWAGAVVLLVVAVALGIREHRAHRRQRRPAGEPEA
jgi:hypothetical protein